MKKTLLFIGLAMCTSIAFAQTNNFNAKANARNAGTMSASFKAADIHPVDYKASIFAKTESGDTIKVWHFDGNDPASMPTVYGTDGRVDVGMTVNGETLEVNAQPNDAATFQYVPDTNWYHGEFFTENYGRLAGSWRAVTRTIYNNIALGHYMLASFISVTHGTGQPHCYMTFAPVARPADVPVINIAFRQVFRKFYDQSFIDYKVNGNWYAREINVDGIDAEVNEYGSLLCHYTMPLTLATQDNIEIRIRYRGGTRSNAYGYFWAIDNLAIIAGGADDWTGQSAEWVDGVYGMLPQGLNIPLTWDARVVNNGINTRTDITAVASHIYNGDTVDILEQNCGSLQAGDPTVTHPVYVNERGFINLNAADPWEAPGFLGTGLQSAYGTDSYPAGFQGRGLPSNNLGQNRVRMSVRSTGADTLYWSSIPYRVVGPVTDEDVSSVLGYRWGHDNGVIGTHSSVEYASYTYGMTDDGVYITDSGNFGTAGYMVASRFTTPANVPEGWVLKGVELITSPYFTSQELDGVAIEAVCMVDEYDFEDSTVSFVTLNTGINGYSRRFSGAELSNEMPYGYMIADENGTTPYNAATFFFPEQPELTPNTSFRVGYQMPQDGYFATAATRNTTLTSDGTYWNFDTLSQTTAGYGRNFTPNSYDIIVRDPMSEDGRVLWSGYYNSSFPMIRAIVGPREELPVWQVRPSCTDSVAMEYLNENVCGQEVEAAEGGSPAIYIFVNEENILQDGNHYVLDKLYIDGQEVIPVTEDNLDGDENFYTEGNDYVIVPQEDLPAEFQEDWPEGFVALERNYWVYTFEDIHATHEIRATVRYADHTPYYHPAAIDPVAAGVSMYLAPNPATSQVAIILKGVTGMVNCNIIDMSGRVVYNNTIDAEHAQAIDLNGVPAGAYFVRINNDSFVKVEKLIVR